MSKLAEDFARFHRLAVETGDVDPVYPVIRTYGEAMTSSHEERVRLTFLHVAYYNLGSAIHAWSANDPRAPELLHLPTGVERRGHRSPAKLARHLNYIDAVSSSRDGLAGWLDRRMEGCADPMDRWDAVSDAVLSLYGNGRWAAYKTCEMLAKVNGYDLAAPDMGHAYSSGPRQGLALLAPDAPEGNSPAAVEVLDYLAEQVVAQLREAELPGVETETVETTLCDFHSMVNGGYYVGHDIDALLAALLAWDEKSLPGHNVLMAARRAAFPDAYLGELHGWSRPSIELKRHYKLTGEIIERTGS